MGISPLVLRVDAATRLAFSREVDKRVVSVAIGVSGGIMSSLEGGKFGSGFASAVVAESVGGLIDKLNSQNPVGQSMSSERVIAASVVEGTTSLIAGGKFGNSALTAGFGRALNEEAKVA